MGWNASPSNRQSSIPMGLRQFRENCQELSIQEYILSLQIDKKQSNDDFVFTHVLCIYFQLLLLHFQGVQIVKTKNLNTGIKGSRQ